MRRTLLDYNKRGNINFLEDLSQDDKFERLKIDEKRERNIKNFLKNSLYGLPPTRAKP